MTTTLYGYWRSSAAYRLRIALNLKGVPHERVSINLKAGEQHGEAWRAMQPQGLVPVLEHDGTRLMQSPAILEWIEETWPEPALLPSDPAARCLVRGWAAVIACDIHPVQNLRILKAISEDLGQGPEGMKAWAQRWMTAGLESLEAMVGRPAPFDPLPPRRRPGDGGSLSRAADVQCPALGGGHLTLSHPAGRR